MFKDNLNHDLSQPVYLPTAAPSPIPTIVINTQKETTSLFVPYWTVTNQPIDTTGFNKVIFFGISPTEDGVDSSETSISQLSAFSQAVPATNSKVLALRMTNSQLNLNILKNKTNQTKIIAQTIEIAKQNNFNTVLLDLEVSAIPFDALIQQINSFTKTFSQQSKANNLSFTMTIYGDNFYRLRPFDLKELSKYTDTIMIMAYDFHKANGAPGPNFPLSGKETYGYDLQKMTDDFLQFVPPQKIAVIFGLFGYDWTIDNHGNAINQATPLTDLQIQQKFLNNCQYNQCKITKDKLSAETQIKYTDANNEKHEVWFEDQNSMKQKEIMLKQKGIKSFSMWAYSYF
jgi:spore germination protein YaaH